MRVARALSVLLALAGGLLATPVHAADAPITLTLAQRWQTAGSLGDWSAYQVTVQNDGGSDFTGDVVLAPAPNRGDQTVLAWPAYKQRVTVPRTSVRSLFFYVVQAPAGYQAEVRDLTDHQVANAAAASSTGSGYAVGLLSDVRDGDSRISSLRPLPPPYTLAVTRFPSAQAFPNNEVYLNGLQALVIDDFDTGALSQAQVQAVRDFVGLGGTLILGGGASWRRTLQPLPQQLLPMKPTASAVAGLAPLAELGELGADDSALTAQVVTGTPNGGRAVLGAAGQPALEVEGVYGAGRLVQLAYDPFAPPFDGNASMAALNWAQALMRGLSEQGFSGRGFGSGPLGLASGRAVFVGAVQPLPDAASPAPAPPPISQPLPPQLGPGAYESQISGLLHSTADAALPPLGLMAGLLVGYILLIGPLLYLGLRAARRRELAWVAVPLIAVLFTGFAYVTGIGSRGSQFFDNLVEIQQLGPGGAIEARDYHGIFAPHSGSYQVRVPPNTLVSTVLGTFESLPAPGQSAVIESGVRSQVTVNGAAVWSMQTVQTLSVTHEQASVDAHLTLAKGHVHGTVTNKTPWTLERLTLQAGAAGSSQGGLRAPLVASLAPGATATVDGDLVTPGAAALTPLQTSGKPAGVDSSGQSNDKKSTVLGIALNRAVLTHPGSYSLVAVSTPASTLQIDGTAPSRSGLAALIVPIAMDSVDTLPAGRQARLVSSFTVLPRYVNVYDVEIPKGVGGTLKLTYSFPQPSGGGGDRVSVSSLEVYDWADGSWHSLPPQTGNQPAALSLDPSEVNGGLVRVRAVESSVPGSANPRLVAGS